MSGPGTGQAGGGGGPPTEEELRAAYEAELSRISATDMIAQSAVSLLNIGAWRMSPPPAAPGEAGNAPVPGRDLEQARDAIDAAGALLEILQRRMPDEVGPLRDALSRLQMAYAREVGQGSAEAPPPAQGGGESPPAAGTPPPGDSSATPEQAPPPAEPGQQQGDRPPGPAESSGRLWVPGR